MQLEEAVQAYPEAWAAYRELEQLWFGEVFWHLDLANLLIELHDLLHAFPSAEETE